MPPRVRRPRCRIKRSTPGTVHRTVSLRTRKAARRHALYLTRRPALRHNAIRNYNNFNHNNYVVVRGDQEQHQCKKTTKFAGVSRSGATGSSGWRSPPVPSLPQQLVRVCIFDCRPENRLRRWPLRRVSARRPAFFIFYVSHLVLLSRRYTFASRTPVLRKLGAAATSLKGREVSVLFMNRFL